MAAKTGNMNSLFIEKEKDFYNRDIKKIFKGRIVNATDKKFALGSYEIVHDSDIAVKVEMGVASTTKNRFKEKGMTLNVFEDKKNNL
jgi:hypothetical protein